jgi:signal transduction histidine kinase/CheY-like chemotaxis protein
MARQSLLWKYTLHFGGMVSALLIASGAVSGYFAYREAVDAIRSVQQARARFAATEIQNYCQRLQLALGGIVQKLDTMDAADPEHVRLELIALLRYHPEVSDLRLVDGRSGTRFELSRYGIAPTSPELAVDGLRRRVDRDGNFVGEVYFREETEPYATFAALSPTTGRTLQAEINLRYVWDVILQSQANSGGVTYVVDRRGQLIAHPDAGLVFARTDLSRLPQVRRALGARAVEAPGGTDARDPEGLAMVSAAAPIERLGWTVFAEQPLDDAFRPVYASLKQSIALVLIGVAAAVAASLLLSRRMVKPIRAIETRARQLAQGQFEQRIDARGGSELDALAAQFNRMAERLQDVHEGQEARIRERTQELATANQAKTRFLAVASHDLRQPIHALALFVGELNAIDLPPEAAPLALRIERSVDALEVLLEALLDLSKLDIGAVAVEPRGIALQPLLERLAAQFRLQAADKGLRIVQVSTSAWVRSDPLLLERILLNLISNALHYTRRGRIVIGCRSRGAEVDIVVADSGIGIAADHLPKVFDEFFRGAAAGTESHAGLGLGLAIVKRLSVVLCHQVSIDSCAGKGTVVRVRVPRAAPQALPGPVLAPDATPTAADVLRRRRVLVIDDETQAREAMRGLLARWGCDVETASNGDGAISSARRRPPDIVLCDLRLAGEERGIEVVASLRRHCQPGAAFVFVTGESAPELIAAARGTGHLLLSKPLAPAKLRAALEHLVTAGA